MWSEGVGLGKHRGGDLLSATIGPLSPFAANAIKRGLDLAFDIELWAGTVQGCHLIAHIFVS